MTEYFPSQDVYLPEQVYKNYQESYDRPSRRISSQFSTTQMILLLVGVIVLLYTWKTELLTSKEVLIFASAIIILGYIAMQSGMFDNKECVPVDVQMERCKKWVEAQQKAGNVELGRIWMNPEFRCQKLDNEKYTNDYFFVKVLSIDDSIYQYVIIADPYVNGRGVIGMYRAPDGFITPPPIQDLIQTSTIAEQYARRLGLSKYQFLKGKIPGVR